MDPSDFVLKLNQITKPNSYPLPLIDDILALLGRAKYFTSLDLKSGYWQVLMDENDKEKTAFACHRGLFEFNVMPFGLTSAPAVFQELMVIVLQGLNHYATAYLDDILIYSETLEDHLIHLQNVFDRLREHGLKLKLKKCSFLQSETHYLGFIINSRGIQLDPQKIEAIKSLLSPTCVREVRSFIGMGSYYRRFIPNFSEIAEPVIALTRKHHLIHLQNVFDRLREHGLKLKLKKCSFLQSETHYLGFIINSRGIQLDPQKIEAIKSLLSPTCVREVRSFIGMGSYYRRFIPNFSEIAEPVIALTRKHARFKWTDDCQRAFEYLKQSFTVAYPDPNKPYTLYTDASNSYIGACLTQSCDENEEILPNVKNEKPIY